MTRSPDPERAPREAQRAAEAEDHGVPNASSTSVPLLVGALVAFAPELVALGRAVGLLPPG